MFFRRTIFFQQCPATWPHSHMATQPHCHTAPQPHDHTAARSYGNTTTQSYGHMATWPHGHTATRPHGHTATRPHGHTRRSSGFAHLVTHAVMLPGRRAAPLERPRQKGRVRMRPPSIPRSESRRRPLRQAGAARVVYLCVDTIIIIIFYISAEAIFERGAPAPSSAASQASQPLEVNLKPGRRL